MTVSEYKDKFLKLFDELEKEHGAVKNVSVYHDSSVVSFGGDLVVNNSRCSIEF